MRCLLLSLLLLAAFGHGAEGEETLAFKIIIVQDNGSGCFREQVFCRLTFAEIQRYLPLTRQEWERMAAMNLVHYFRVVVAQKMSGPVA